MGRSRAAIFSTLGAVLTALVAFSMAGDVHAYAIRYVVDHTQNWTTTGFCELESACSSLRPGDVVQVDIYLDADTGLQILSFGVHRRQAHDHRLSPSDDPAEVSIEQVPEAGRVVAVAELLVVLGFRR